MKRPTRPTASAPKPKPLNAQPYFRSAVIVLAGLLVITLVGYGFRGWVRVTVLPKLADTLYLPGVRHTMNSEAAALHAPFGQLGLHKIINQQGCRLQLAQKLHTSIDCSDNDQAYTVLPASPAAVTNLQQAAARLQSDLLANGWTSGSNGVTLTSLIDGTAKGIDYSPDAYYAKTSHGSSCTFDTFIAYANPQPPAIRSVLSCYRSVDFFGAPALPAYRAFGG